MCEIQVSGQTLGGGHCEVVEILAGAGARLDILSGTKGKTPLEVARHKNQNEVIPVIQRYLQLTAAGKVRRLYPEEASDRSAVGNLPITNEEKASKDGRKIHFEEDDQDRQSKPDPANRQALKQMLRAQLENLEAEESLEALKEEKAKIEVKLSEAKGKEGSEAQELESTISDLKKKLEAARSSQAGEIEGLEASLEEVNNKINQMEVKQSQLKEKM